MRSKNAKPLIALALTGAGSALVIAFQVPDSAVIGSPSSSTGTTLALTGTTAAATAGSAATSTPEPAATATSSSLYADGTWTGDAEQEPWGTFQVEVTISSGQITDVTVISAPNDGHSDRINTIAVPVLTESVLAAQGTSVDLVSGATWTSESYLTSLQAALDQAAAQNGN